MQDVIILLPVLLVCVCFILLSWRFKRLWERSLAREARLNKMVEELLAAAPPQS